MILNKGVSTSLFQKPYAFHAVNLQELRVTFSWMVKDDLQESNSIIEKWYCLWKFKEWEWSQRKFLELLLTQKATSHPNGPITAEQGGPRPVGPANGGGGDVTLILMPAITTSTAKIHPRTEAITLFCAKIWEEYGWLAQNDGRSYKQHTA